MESKLFFNADWACVEVAIINIVYGAWDDSLYIEDTPPKKPNENILSQITKELECLTPEKTLQSLLEFQEEYDQTWKVQWQEEASKAPATDWAIVIPKEVTEVLTASLVKTAEEAAKLLQTLTGSLTVAGSALSSLNQVLSEASVLVPPASSTSAKPPEKQKSTPRASARNGCNRSSGVAAASAMHSSRTRELTGRRRSTQRMSSSVDRRTIAYQRR